MLNVADQTYLLSKQYRDGANLNARVALHVMFSINQTNWHRWIFDHIKLPADARVLELGAGVGWLWRENRDRIPPGWDITLSDLSPGMLDEAKQGLQPERPFTFQLIDAQAIPFPDATFDAVIANHMLYHVPDRPRALAEIRRVLKPTGRLYASTVGDGHLAELNAIVRRWVPELPDRGMPFTLENGQAQLEAVFEHVERYDIDDALKVTQAEPLVSYIRSMQVGDVFEGPAQAELRAFVEGELARDGVIHITKASGLFVAWG